MNMRKTLAIVAALVTGGLAITVSYAVKAAAQSCINCAFGPGSPGIGIAGSLAPGISIAGDGLAQCGRCALN
jgi:hypothetical protein